MLTDVAICLIATGFLMAQLYRGDRKKQASSLFFGGFFSLNLCAMFALAMGTGLSPVESSFILHFCFISSILCLYFGLLWRVESKQHLVGYGLYFQYMLPYMTLQVLAFTLAYDSALLRKLTMLVFFLIFSGNAIRHLFMHKTRTTGELMFLLTLEVIGVYLVASTLTDIFWPQYDLTLINLFMPIVGHVLLFAGLTALLTSDLTEDFRVASITDPLTGLYNRRFFLEQAEVSDSSAKRYKESLSVIMCDIDFFKNINDRYGHAMGDKALIATAKTLQNIKRDSDVLARFGGEEFAVLLPQTDEQGAADMAERMRQAIASLSIPALTTEVRLTVSFGVAMVKPDMSIEEAMICADNALYDAKLGGRNMIKICGQYQPSDKHKAQSKSAFDANHLPSN